VKGGIIFMPYKNGKSAWNFKDLTSKTFGRLIVLDRAENKHRKARWNCECQCEKKTKKTILGQDLIRQKVQSCGCISSENNIKRSTRHGQAKTRLYNIYLGQFDTLEEASEARRQAEIKYWGNER